LGQHRFAFSILGFNVAFLHLFGGGRQPGERRKTRIRRMTERASLSCCHPEQKRRISSSSRPRDNEENEILRHCAPKDDNEKCCFRALRSIRVLGVSKR